MNSYSGLGRVLSPFLAVPQFQYSGKLDRDILGDSRSLSYLRKMNRTKGESKP